VYNSNQWIIYYPWVKLSGKSLQGLIMLKLKIVGDRKEGIWLVEPKVSVGSAASNNLVVKDPDVDDCHIEIFAKGEELIIHRRSDAATLVNGNKLGIKAKLSVDDEITIGSTRLQVIDPKVINQKSGGLTDEPTLQGESKSWLLVPKQTGLGSKRYEIKDGTVIGRSKECDIVILLAHLSRRHARFSVVNKNRLEITDLNSSNGTYVNGKQIATTVLKHGDEVKLDSLAFTVSGPSDDLDKTMVRPMQIDALGLQLADHKPNSDEPRPAAPAAKVQANASAPQTPAKDDPAKSSATSIIVIAVVAVVVVIAGVLLLI
jgi:pSer/pThr/pTyr-binding forkhead associated (FHA) protein